MPHIMIHTPYFTFTNYTVALHTSVQGTDYDGDDTGDNECDEMK